MGYSVRVESGNVAPFATLPRCMKVRVVAFFLSFLSFAASAHAQGRDGEGAPTLEPKLDAPKTTTPPQPVIGDVQRPFAYEVYGYLRVGYDFTTKDDRYTFIGRN